MEFGRRCILQYLKRLLRWENQLTPDTFADAGESIVNALERLEISETNEGD
jgi:hypothetical protein